MYRIEMLFSGWSCKALCRSKILSPIPHDKSKFCFQEERGYFIPFGVALSPCLFKNDLCMGQVRKVKQWGLWF